MKFILEYKRYSEEYEAGDIVYIRYWYLDRLISEDAGAARKLFSEIPYVKVKIIGKEGRKFRVSYDIEGSALKGAPEELIQKKRILQKSMNESLSDPTETLKEKLLSIDGNDVKLGLDSEEELQRMVKDGTLFGKKIIRIKGERGRCHKNVADRYRRIGRDKFRIASGYALSDGVWYQHSWGLDRDENVIETTGNEYDEYYGYILNEEESDDFCFDNY